MHDSHLFYIQIYMLIDIVNISEKSFMFRLFHFLNFRKF